MGMLVWDAWGILTCLGNPPLTLPLTSLPGRLRNQKGRSGGSVPDTHPVPQARAS